MRSRPTRQRETKLAPLRAVSPAGLHRRMRSWLPTRASSSSTLDPCCITRIQHHAHTQEATRWIALGCSEGGIERRKQKGTSRRPRGHSKFSLSTNPPFRSKHCRCLDHNKFGNHLCWRSCRSCGLFSPSFFLFYICCGVLQPPSPACVRWPA